MFGGRFKVLKVLCAAAIISIAILYCAKFANAKMSKAIFPTAAIERPLNLFDENRRGMKMAGGQCKRAVRSRIINVWAKYVAVLVWENVWAFAGFV